jgi:tetratricopeptide (TPR) repeat protein
MNTPVESKLVIKISLLDDIRRVSVDPSLNFESLKLTVKRLYKTLTEEEANTLIIRYQDDESDWITVSSDEELKEAISLLKSDKVLRLTLSHPVQVPRHGPCGWRRKWMREHGKFGCHKGSEEHSHQGDPSHHEGEEHHQGFGRWRRSEEHSHHGGEHSHHEGEEHHQGWGRWCRGRGRFFRMHRHAISLMETGTKANLEAARALFFEQLRIIPGSAVPLYNIACCEALLGNSKPALEFLQKAISAGYRDVAHMEKDEDLKSLRDLEEYKAVISSLKSNSAVSNVPATPIPSEIPSAPASVKEPVTPAVVFIQPQPSAPALEPKKPEAKVEKSEKDNRKALALVTLADMGFCDQRKNEEVLARANYDVATAVQILISENFVFRF